MALSVDALTRLSEALSRESQADLAVAVDGRNRRAQGIYFTPPALVSLVVSEALAAWTARRDLTFDGDGAPSLRVLDPAAGDGRFLAGATEVLTARAEAAGIDAEVARDAILRTAILGFERDPELCAMARRRLPGATIYCVEALCDAPAVAPVDLVVGNPPYVRSIRLGQTDSDLRQRLRGKLFATSAGEWDLYGAFLEQSLQWLAPGGEIGLVVPSRWLTAAFAAPLRGHLAKRRAVRAIIDFGADQVFANATTYASVAFLSRTPTGRIDVARRGSGGWSTGTIESRTLGAAPWRLCIGRPRAVIEAMQRRGPRLGDIARIVKGAGTNADPVYVLEGARRQGDLVIGRSRAQEREVCVEAAVCPVCIRGRDVGAFSPPDESVRCILPYGDDGRLIPPAEFLARAPRAAEYLASMRARLDAREGGRFRGDTFYRFGRPQNLAFHAAAEPKVVVPDVARGGRAMMDQSGALVLDSAYAVRLVAGAGPSLALVWAVLGSRAPALWLSHTGIVLRGGYVRMKTAYLRSLPIPGPCPQTQAIEDCFVHSGTVWQARASAGEIDDLVRQAYGVSAADWAI